MTAKNKELYISKHVLGFNFGIMLFILVGFSNLCFSQAKPAYNQYILNNYILNPGVTGIENYGDLKMSYRNQWQGINGAPVTTYLTYNAPVGKMETRTNPNSMDVVGNSPMGQKFTEEYIAPEPHHGVGVAFVNDRAGYINQWSLSGSYAYHRPVSYQSTLSGGISAGLSGIRLDRTQIDFSSLETNDPAIGYTNLELNKLKVDIGVGLWLYSTRYYAGFSALNVIPGKSQFVRSANYGFYYTPNYFLTGGYKIYFNTDFSMTPSVMLQYWKPQLTGVHFSSKLQYRDYAWLGATYRHADLLGGYSAYAGLNVMNTFTLSYSYEVANSTRLKTYTNNTHEIMIGLMFGNTYSKLFEKNVW